MRIFQVDAFTATRFTGNPATVVLDADGQSDLTLQAVAKEFAHAEVAFVLAANGPDHDLRIRFFNSRKEAAFVGHATIAAHSVLMALGRRVEGTCRQLSGTGVIEVSALNSQFEFRQTAPELDSPMPFKTTLRVAEALRLPATHLHEAMPARLARKGSTRLLIPIAERSHLEGIAPNFEHLMAIGSELGADGFFAFAVHREADEIATEARMFCPALGIPEDPVSGNAHAMLAAYLWDLGQFGKKTSGFIGHQGRFMQRPGVVNVRLEIDAGRFAAAHIGGSAVIVSEGTLAL